MPEADDTEMQLPHNAPVFIREFYLFMNDFMRHSPDRHALEVAEASKRWVRDNYYKENGK